MNPPIILTNTTVSPTRTINTTSPLCGGGNLYQDLNLCFCGSSGGTPTLCEVLTCCNDANYLNIENVNSITFTCDSSICSAKIATDCNGGLSFSGCCNNAGVAGVSADGYLVGSAGCLTNIPVCNPFDQSLNCTDTPTFCSISVCGVTTGNIGSASNLCLSTSADCSNLSIINGATSTCGGSGDIDIHGSNNTFPAGGSPGGNINITSGYSCCDGCGHVCLSDNCSYLILDGTGNLCTNAATCGFGGGTDIPVGVLGHIVNYQVDNTNCVGDSGCTIGNITSLFGFGGGNGTLPTYLSDGSLCSSGCSITDLQGNIGLTGTTGNIILFNGSGGGCDSGCAVGNTIQDLTSVLCTGSDAGGIGICNLSGISLCNNSSINNSSNDICITATTTNDSGGNVLLVGGGGCSGGALGGSIQITGGDTNGGAVIITANGQPSDICLCVPGDGHIILTGLNYADPCVMGAIYMCGSPSTGNPVALCISGG